MNRAQSQNPFTRLKNEAAALAGARPLVERSNGVSGAPLAPLEGEALTREGEGGLMTWDSLTEMDFTNSDEALTS